MAESVLYEEFQDVRAKDVTFYDKMPLEIVLCPAADAGMAKLKGPSSRMERIEISDKFAARSVSLYPQEKKVIQTKVCKEEVEDDEGMGDSSTMQSIYRFKVTYTPFPKKKRLGDPICDNFGALLNDDRALLVVADGCGWGVKNAVAARAATLAFLEEMKPEILKPENAGNVCLKLFHSLRVAHEAVLKSFPAIKRCGSTTICAGAVLPASGPDYTHILLAIGVGDCKMVVIRGDGSGVVDVTEGNRVSSPTDPGGRIGAYGKNEGTADLRNLSFYHEKLSQGDVVVIMSDGVYDNMDPQLLKVEPHHIGLKSAPWEEQSDQERVLDCKKLFFLEMMKVLSEGTETPILSPPQILAAIINFCRNASKSGRVWMAKNPNRRMPEYSDEFRGKMDHCTCMIYAV